MKSIIIILYIAFTGFAFSQQGGKSVIQSESEKGLIGKWINEGNRIAGISEWYGKDKLIINEDATFQVIGTSMLFKKSKTFESGTWKVKGDEIQFIYSGESYSIKNRKNQKAAFLANPRTSIFKFKIENNTLLFISNKTGIRNITRFVKD